MICTILTWRAQFEMPRNGDWINARLLGVATAATLRLVSYGCFLEPRSSCFCCFRQDVSISCSSQQINPAMCCSKDSQVGKYSSHVIRNTCGKGVRETWRHSFWANSSQRLQHFKLFQWHRRNVPSWPGISPRRWDSLHWRRFHHACACHQRLARDIWSTY